MSHLIDPPAKMGAAWVFRCSGARRMRNPNPTLPPFSPYAPMARPPFRREP